VVSRGPTHVGKDDLGSDLRRRTARALSVLRIGHTLIAGCDIYATMRQCQLRCNADGSLQQPLQQPRRAEAS
jgi:hypothetical protein